MGTNTLFSVEDFLCVPGMFVLNCSAIFAAE